MNIYLRFLGGGLVMVAALIASREYSAYAQKRLEQYRGLIEFLSHAEGMISRFLASGDGLLTGFKNKALEDTGFLSALREGKGFSESFAMCESKFAFSEEQKALIKKFCSDVGRGYKESEALTFACFRKTLESEMEREKETLDKSVKVARALLLGGALAFLIVVI